MADRDNTPQPPDSQCGNGQLAEFEPHCLHLLEAHSAELLAECHRAGLYLALCGEELVTEDLPDSECEPGCDRDVVYCLECIGAASRRNHEVGGMVLDR